MKFPFSKVAVLGLGLIGGSLALDLKRLGLAQKVVGYNRSAGSRRLALKRRACDKVFADPAAAVQDADLVVLALPVRRIPALAKSIAPRLKKGAILTDVGSTKEALNRKVRKVLPSHALWVGGHPIAGTENTGMKSALPGLFQDRWWILTPKGKKEGRAAAALKRFFEFLGAKVKLMPEAEHDRIFATVSHLPHLLAFSLMHLAGQAKRRRSLGFAGSSFRDATRVAASSPEMWIDICLDNQNAILAALNDYEKLLRRLKKSLRAGEEKSLGRYFGAAAKARRKL